MKENDRQTLFLFSRGESLTFGDLISNSESNVPDVDDLSGKFVSHAGGARRRRGGEIIGDARRRSGAERGVNGRFEDVDHRKKREKKANGDKSSSSSF